MVSLMTYELKNIYSLDLENFQKFYLDEKYGNTFQHNNYLKSLDAERHK